MIEKIGGLTFKDGVLVSSFDAEAEIANRGGLDAMLEQSTKNNALFGLLKREMKKPSGPDMTHAPTARLFSRG